MAPPRKHETDVILDAARALVLTDGPRAASVAAIAKASGAPTGTLYHRFGDRNGILAAAWLRALERFQSRAMAATADAPLEAAVAMAVSVSKGRRFVADEVTRAIGELSGQEYVHLYASDVKTRLAAGDGGD